MAETSELSVSSSDRLAFAVRQIALVAVALFVLSAMTSGIRPAEAADRDIVTSPFRWTIVVWAVLLLFNAIGSERSQMRQIEGRPLLAALAIGVATFLVGVATFDAGSTGDRLLFLILNSVGVALFWWALIGLGYLMWNRFSCSD